MDRRIRRRAWLGDDNSYDGRAGGSDVVFRRPRAPGSIPASDESCGQLLRS